jgi:hypothetical protein
MRIFLVGVLLLSGLDLLTGSAAAASHGVDVTTSGFETADRHHHHHHQGHKRKVRRADPALTQPMTGMSAAVAGSTTSALASTEVADSVDLAIALAAAAGLGLVGGLRLRATNRE